jgi:hypothetical protein
MALAAAVTTTGGGGVAVRAITEWDFTEAE